MGKLIQMVTDIVASHASTTRMTKEELISELSEVYQTLSGIEQGQSLPVVTAREEEKAPVITKRKAFRKDKVMCMICGKEMKTLARHLKSAHELTPKEYRNQFDIPRSQPLAARSYSEIRRKMAVERGLGEKLVKARAAKGKRKARAKK